MVTALCNVFINSEEKFSLFKDNFSNVYKISDNWLVYIRGKFKDEALNFVKKIDSERNNCTIFENLYDNNWAKSVREVMMEKARYEYIYVFLEDHFLLKSIDHFRNVIQDMIDSRIDYFQYSFFNIGLPAHSIENLYPDKTRYFFITTLNPDQLNGLRKSNSSFYPYSLTGVSSKKYFENLLNIEKKHLLKVPYLLQILMENIIFLYPKNRAFWFWLNGLAKKIGLRFVIYSPATPFNLEKSLFDCNDELLPFKVGALKEELFVNWDDDNKLNNSSLVKRGLYPKHFRIEKKQKPESILGRDYILKKGESKNFCYYPDVARITKLPEESIFIKKGSLEVSSDKESFILNEGQSAWIFSNIPHSFLAHEDCVFHVYLNNYL